MLVVQVLLWLSKALCISVLLGHGTSCQWFLENQWKTRFKVGASRIHSFRTWIFICKGTGYGHGDSGRVPQNAIPMQLTNILYPAWVFLLCPELTFLALSCPPPRVWKEVRGHRLLLPPKTLVTVQWGWGSFSVMIKDSTPQGAFSLWVTVVHFRGSVSSCSCFLMASG